MRAELASYALASCLALLPISGIAGNTDSNRTPFSKDSDKVILARMLFGEARGCTPTEKVAVAYTALNRANDGIAWNGRTVKEAVLKPYQYSCFNKKDPNRKKLENPAKEDILTWANCLEISRGVLNGEYKDPTNGATSYHTLKSHPYWASSPQFKKIGRIPTEKGPSKHVFYSPAKHSK